MTSSEKYQLMADMCRIAEFIEWDESDYFDFCDNGSTLQVNASLIEQCRTHPNWAALESQWESIPSCSIWVPDDENFWEVA